MYKFKAHLRLSKGFGFKRAQFWFCKAPQPVHSLTKYALNQNLLLDVSQSHYISSQLKLIAERFKVPSFDKKVSHLIYFLVTKSQFLNEHQRLFICEYIIKEAIHSEIQITEALSFMKREKFGVPEDAQKKEAFEDAIGANLTYTFEQISQYVDTFINENLPEVLQKPHQAHLLAKLKKGLMFASAKALVDCYETKSRELKNSVGGQDSVAQRQSASPLGGNSEGGRKEDMNAETELKEISYRLDNLSARDLDTSINSPEVLKRHYEEVGSKVITRFPPEPNGFLHIGHCKAMRFNFKIASDHGGLTILRYDDSNPETETIEYIDQIRNDLLWMGHSPHRITYASDYFDKILDCAFELIKQNKAYVCFLSSKEFKTLREQKLPSPFRETPAEANLVEFRKMISGCYDEGQAVLRAKIAYSHDNPCMRDPVIYRVKYASHPKTGTKHCVYPIYDFVHPLCDSFENVTHSLCTLEFENRRELYYWPLEALNLYKPFVWEYSRLNIAYNVLSKRKLMVLIKKGLVDGWDDPRLLTIKGMKRRGYSPEAINTFCDNISVTRRGNDTFIEYENFENEMRKHLKETCRRAFCVLEPVELRIMNYQDHVAQDPAEEFIHPLELTERVFVDKADVSLKDFKEFYGIAPNKVVRLRYGPFLKIRSVEWGGSDSPAEEVSLENIHHQRIKVFAEIVDERTIPSIKSVKGILHWLPVGNAVDCKVLLYEPLFSEKIPGERTGNFLDDLNLKSKTAKDSAKISAHLVKKLSPGFKVQFERLGYFALDEAADVSTPSITWNRITSLKDKNKVRNLNNVKAI